jgi:dihydrofolate reductase
MMEVSLIVAMDANKGIGKNNDLMWRLPKDMNFFKTTTEHHVVIMGRKNYDSIPLKYRPLSNRLNVIITRNRDFQADGCLVFHSLEEAFAHFKNDKRELFVIGGGQIYTLVMEMDVLSKMYITHVGDTFEADTFFPDFDHSTWEASQLLHQEQDERHQCGFKTLLYTKLDK